MTGLAHMLLNALVLYAALVFAATKRAAAFAALGVGAVLLSTIVAYGARDLRQSLASPPLWDVRCFWLYGRTITQTHAPYSPSAMQRTAASLPTDPVFTREVVDVGFPYPPPTAALVAPLGFFTTPQAAAPLWYGLLLAALAAQIILLWRVFLRGDRWWGLAAAAFITLFLPTTPAVLTIGQTLFVAQVFFLLYLWDEQPVRGGMWLALAAIVKPFCLLVFVLPALRRQWNVLLAGAGTIVAATLAVVPIVGWKSLVSYAVHPPALRWPANMFSAESNQSLLAWIQRHLHESPQAAQALRDPFFLAFAAVFAVLTLWRVAHARNDRVYSATMLLSLALLIYPESLWHYTSMLTAPLALLWGRRTAFPYGAIVAAAFTAAVFMLSMAENLQFYAFAATWALLFAAPPRSVGITAAGGTHHEKRFPVLRHSGARTARQSAHGGIGPERQSAAGREIS